MEIWAVPFLVFLLAGHPQGLGSDLLQIALLREEQVDGVVRDLLLHRHHLICLMVKDDVGPPRDSVLFLYLLQLPNDESLDPLGGVDSVLQVGDLVRECVHLLGAFEDVLLVDVTQTDIGHILRLYLVDAKADHQVWDDLGVLLGVPDDLNSPVDIQKDTPQTLQQMQLLLFLVHGVVYTTADRVHAPGGPLLQDLPHPHDPWHPGDEDIEVAGLAVQQGGEAEQLGHQLVRISSPL